MARLLSIGFVLPWTIKRAPSPALIRGMDVEFYNVYGAIRQQRRSGVKELLRANTIQVDTIYQLLIEKGYFTQAEFLAKMKEVQMDYVKGENLPKD
jgi:hypothetical protein